MIKSITREIFKNKYLYIMAVPVLAYYVIFCYLPMYGTIMAFENYSPAKGFTGSEWIWFKNFKDFFTDIYFGRIIGNTLIISAFSIIFGFPAPVILALLLNEIRKNAFKRFVQTITYLPHFISLIVVCGMILDFTTQTGVINSVIIQLGGQPVSFMTKAEWFRPIYIGTDIWQEVGWGSIIYLAALAGINPEHYEAATIDGAGRWRRLIHVTIPGIMPVVMILLILRMGYLMSVGFEKIILLYSPTTYQTADVISTYVYRMGLQQWNFGYSSAVGLFNSVINFVMLFAANWLSKKADQTSLW